MLYLEAGGAHGDAHIRQQGAEVFPFERPGPAFDQDVPPAHGAQHRATHLDGDKGGAPLLLGHTHEHVHILLWSPSFYPLPAGLPSWWNINRLISSLSFLTSKLILAVNGSSSASSKPSSILKACSSEWWWLRTNSSKQCTHFTHFNITFYFMCVFYSDLFSRKEKLL